MIIFGMYITTLKKPLPGIFTRRSVNQTARSRDSEICGLKLPIQMIIDQSIYVIL